MADSAEDFTEAEAPTGTDEAPQQPEGEQQQQPAGGEEATSSNNTSQEVVGSPAMRPVFMGNLRPEFDAELVKEIFTKPIVPPGSEQTFAPISVDRVEVKRGFCFVFLKDAASQQVKEDTEAFVRAINGMELAGVSDAMRVEFARGDGRMRRKEDDRRRNIEPSETLFVVNFHEETTQRQDLQMLFEPYGDLIRVDMKRNYAFVQFRTVAEATRALEATNGGKLDQNVLSVEYVAQKRRDYGDRRGGGRGGGRYNDHRGGDRGRGGGGYDYRRGGGPSYRGGGGAPPPVSRGYGSDRRGGPDRYADDGLPPPRDDYHPRGGRDRSPVRGYRDDHRPRDSYRNERAISPPRGGPASGYARDVGYGGRGRSRSRSRSPPRGGGGGGYRSSRSPPAYRYEDDRRYEDPAPPRGGDRRAPPPPVGGGGWSPADDYRDRRSPERGFYRGRDDRGYRG